MSDDEICPIGEKKEKPIVSPEQPPDCSDIAGRQCREALEDRALALREGGHYYYEIAEQLGLGNPPNQGTAYRLVQRALWRRMPDEATARRLMRIDAQVMRLLPRVKRHDPDATVELRNLLHERLVLTEPLLADTPLPGANPQERERDRQLCNTLRAMAREDAKLLASIPGPSPEEVAEAAIELGFRIGRDGLPRPPRRRRR